MTNKDRLLTTAAKIRIVFDERTQRRMAQMQDYPWLYDRAAHRASVSATPQTGPADRRAASQAEYAPFYQ